MLHPLQQESGSVWFGNAEGARGLCYSTPDPFYFAAMQQKQGDVECTHVIRRRLSDASLRRSCLLKLVSRELGDKLRERDFEAVVKIPQRFADGILAFL